MSFFKDTIGMILFIFVYFIIFLQSLQVYLSYDEDPDSYLIELTGPQIEDKYRKSGKLRINYCISYDEGSFHNFTLYVDGDGVWRGRKEELRRYINFKLEAV